GAADGTAFAAAFFNQPWLRKAWAAGETRAVEGVLEKRGRRFVLKAARVLPADAQPGGEVQLRYAELDGVAAARLPQWIALALDRLDWAEFALPPLPQPPAAHDRPPRSLVLAMHRPAPVAEAARARAGVAPRAT